MTRKWASVLVMAATAVFVAHALYLRCVAEDAFISFRYARNLAGGHGLVWNIGEPPVEGYTNFLWVVLCAGAIRAGLDVVGFALAAGIGAGAAVIVVTYRVARKALGCNRPGAVAACLVLALYGPLAAWSSSGMETVPFALCVLSGFGFWALYAQRGRQRDGVLGAVVLLAASLLRPEGVMVFGMAVAVGVILWCPVSGVNRAGILLPIAVYAVPGAIYFLWRYRYFGFPLPNTFYAKTGGGLQQYLRGALYALDFAVFYVLPLTPIAFLWAWQAVGTRRALERTRVAAWLRDHFGFVLTLSVLLAYTAYIIYVGGDYMAMYRFFVPPAPLLAILFGWCFARLLTLTPGAGRRRLAWLAAGVCGLAILFPSSPLEAKVLRKPEYHHGRFQGIYRERWHTARLSTIGRFFRGYRDAYDETLATDAIGAIGYYADMKVLDTHGLTDTHIAHRGRGRRVLGSGLPGHEKEDAAYVFSREPTYYMFDRTLREKPAGYPSFGAGLDPIVREKYEPQSVWLEDPFNKEEGYFTFLALRSRG